MYKLLPHDYMTADFFSNFVSVFLLKWAYFFHLILKGKTFHKLNSCSMQTEVKRPTTNGCNVSYIQNKLLAIKPQAPHHLC